MFTAKCSMSTLKQQWSRHHQFDFRALCSYTRDQNFEWNTVLKNFILKVSRRENTLKITLYSLNHSFLPTTNMH